MKSNILFIGRKEKSVWQDFLEVLAVFGSLKIISDRQVETEIGDTEYNLIVIDAAAVEDLPEMVSELKLIKSTLEILIITSAPSWVEARNVLRAGASDYLNRSLTQKEFLSTIKELLDEQRIRSRD